MTTIEKYKASVAEYLERLTWQNLSPQTIRGYEQALRLFGDYLETADADDLYEAIEAWKESMLRAGNSPSTVNQRLTALGIFFKKATKRSFPKELRYAENPVEEVEPVKVVKRPYQEILTDEQAIMLTENTAPKTAKDSLWARNYAIVQLLCNEKIRNAELLDLTLANVDFFYHEITIENGKGRKQRTVDLSPLTESALLLYLAAGIRPDVSDTAPLFGTTAAHKKASGATQGQEAWHRGTTQWLSSLVERQVYAVCGVHDVRSHDLRHVGSRICLNAGTSMEQLQGELGHAQMSTTMIYSGKLMQRRHRDSARAVLAARADAARKNLSMLESMKQKETIRKGA